MIDPLKFGIGITGGIACGKSTICSILRDKGYHVIDADVLSRHVVQNDILLKQQILDEFGTSDRKELGKLVFSDYSLLDKLESLVIPHIKAELFKTVASLPTNNVWFYEASLILKTPEYQRFRDIWVVKCNPETQLRRLMERNKIDEEHAKRIIKRQETILFHLGNKVIYTDENYSVIDQIEQLLYNIKKDTN